mmetsp:Transcript_25009/g.37979  ORF Transcript_25009/g.37979 Transcript_25009/m.37979 type:complete len:411 (+) Transcript_25009:60-1292(+)
MSNYDEDDEQEEQVGLLSSNVLDDEDKNGTYNSKARANGKKGKIEPLEIDEVEVIENMSVVEAKDNRQKRGKNDYESSIVSGCRGLFISIVLAISLSLWLWSDQTAKVYVGVQKYHELRIGDVKHWCLDKKSTFCTCQNPLTPRHRINHKMWKAAHYGNVREATMAGEMGNTDVVFLGDSIIEGWRGLSFGKVNPKKELNTRVFEKLFAKGFGHNADFEGLALGISGDKTFNLLWRLQNGELPDNLHPKIWWLLIGTNDFGHDDKPHCSPEIVLMGVLRVIEELRAARPHTLIVVNSILPRSENGDAAVTFGNGKAMPLWEGILEVNRELEEYCSYNRNMYYFDATSTFLNEKPKTKAQYIEQKMMFDFLHPTARGYQKWGENIVQEIHKLIDVREAEGGRRPINSTLRK